MRIVEVNDNFYRVFRDRRKPRMLGYPGEDNEQLESSINQANSN